MVRAVILYENEPEPERYRQHLDEFVAKVGCDAFRHGKAFGAPFGDPPFRYYAEFEWADREGFKASVGTEEFAASGKDAMAMGIPFTATFIDIA